MLERLNVIPVMPANKAGMVIVPSMTTIILNRLISLGGLVKA